MHKIEFTTWGEIGGEVRYNWRDVVGLVWGVRNTRGHSWTSRFQPKHETERGHCIVLHQKGRYSVKYILPVYHGGRARGQRCRKDSREAAGSDKAGWINILNIHVVGQWKKGMPPKFTTIDNMVLGMSFSDTSSIWSPSCHRVPSTPPNPRAGPTPPPFQGWQNSPKQRIAMSIIWGPTSGNQSSSVAQKLTCCQLDLFKSGLITSRKSWTQPSQKYNQMLMSDLPVDWKADREREKTKFFV